jgi:hypothetical protein
MAKKILMKFTSRDRFPTLIKCIIEYHRLANNPKDMFWLFTFDDDDTTLNLEEFQQLVRYLDLDYYGFFGVSHSKIDAINRDVNKLKDKDWDILLNISDDQLPIVQGYDDFIRDAMPDSLDYSLWFNDGHQSEIITQEILGRKYYDNQGYIYYPAYKSFFCDNESTQVAKKHGKLIKFQSCIVKHFHPVWGANEHIQDDELYKKNNAHWEHDQELHNKRKADGIF